MNHPKANLFGRPADILLTAACMLSVCALRPVHAMARTKPVLVLCPNVSEHENIVGQRLWTDLEGSGLFWVRNPVTWHSSGSFTCATGRGRTRILGASSADYLLRMDVSHKSESVTEVALTLYDSSGHITAESNGLDKNPRIAVDSTVASLLAGLPGLEPTCPKHPGMVCVRAGLYRIGLDNTEVERVRALCENLGLNKSDCRTLITPRAKNIYLHPYLIDRYEVSCLDYTRCIEAGKCGNLANYGSPDCGNTLLPVSNVDVADAAAYCKWMGKRLPTEDEWEVAARGSTSHLFPWGDSFDPDAAALGSAGTPLWSDTRAFKGPGPRPEAGGSFERDESPFGAMDMAGNVAEWTSTPFHSRGSWSPLPWARTFPEQGDESHVIKGGDFAENPILAVTGLRRPWHAGIGGANFLGFRCAAGQNEWRHWAYPVNNP